MIDQVKKAVYGSYRRHVWGLPFQIVIAIVAVVMLLDGKLTHAGISALALLLTFLPMPFEKLIKKRLPWFLQLAYVIFVFSSIFAGEVLGMYGRIHAWDDWLHFGSGILVGIGGILWLTSLMKKWQHNLSAWFQVTFTILVASGVAALWEIAEFLIDQTFGTFMQRNDLHDTMTDMINGTVSAMIVLGLYLIHLKVRRVPVLGYVIDYYKRINP